MGEVGPIAGYYEEASEATIIIVESRSESGMLIGAGSGYAKFGGSDIGEVPRIHLPGTSVNKG
jgi:hypothetical protein